MKTIEFTYAEIAAMGGCMSNLSHAKFEGLMHRELCLSLTQPIIQKLSQLIAKAYTQNLYSVKTRIRKDQASVLVVALLGGNNYSTDVSSALGKLQPMLNASSLKPAER